MSRAVTTQCVIRLAPGLAIRQAEDVYHAVIVACAAALACILETALFQPLSARRVVALAGRTRQPGDSTFPGLPLLLTCALLRRPFALGLQSAMTLLGVPYAAAGGLSGFLEGVLFTPTRRMSTIQLASSEELTVRQLARDIYRAEGLAGFWRGYLLSGARTSLGGWIYFSVIAQMRAWLPGGNELVNGLAAAGAATVLLNPCEVLLTSCFVAAKPVNGWRDLFRGLWPAVLRNVPGGAFRWWLTHALVRLIER